MKKLFLQLIKIYQKTLSPDHGFFYSLNPYRGCRFFPTCSQYMYQAIEHKGVLRGLGLGLRRVLRCHPYSQGGYDPIPHPEIIINNK